MCDINIYGIGNLYVYEIANWKKESGALFTDSCDLEMPVVQFSLTNSHIKHNQICILEMVSMRVSLIVII